MDPITIMMLAGAASSIAGASQGSQTKDEGFEAIPDTTSQKKARQFLKSLYGTKVDYPTQQVAGMSGAETASQDLLNKFLTTDTGADRGKALSFLTGLLDQNIDVTELPEIKALMSTIESQTQDLVNSAMQRTQISGMGTSSSQGSAVGRELAKGKTSMLASLTPYLSEVRSNKLTAADLINSLVTSGETSSINKIGAGMTYGALPRQLEQAGNDATYNKIVNDLLAKFNLQAPAAQAVLNEPRYAYNAGTTTPSTLSTAGSAASNLGLNLAFLKYMNY